MQVNGGQFWYGDCLDLMGNIPDQSVDMILTNIPYNEVNRKSSGLRNLNKSVADDALFDEMKFIQECVRICKGSIYIFCGFKQISFLTSQLIDLKLSTRLGIWHKTNPSPMNGQNIWLSGVESCVFGRKPNATFNQHCKSAVWSFPSTRSKIHPTQKPVELFNYLIESSSNPNDLILDPFAGSGTTAIAARNTSRRFICIEKELNYYLASIGRFFK